jgi:hypothetical protein
VQKKDSRKQFTDSFKVQYSHIAWNHIFNMDKAGIWYIPVPYTILAYVSRSKTIVMVEKHSGRMTAAFRLVLFILILLVISCSKMGQIAKEELKIYSQQHYCMYLEKV